MYLFPINTVLTSINEHDSSRSNDTSNLYFYFEDWGLNFKNT